MTVENYRLLTISSQLLTVPRGAFAVVPFCSCCGSFLFIVCFVGGSVFFPIMVSLFSYVGIPESPLIWETAADLVYHLSHLFTSFPWYTAEFKI